jgi:pimeloyl-ACP methyl ester carboxylesterase
MPTIIVNGVRLAYDEAGAGPPVIWVHGGFTDRHGADLVVPLLSARYRLITYDRRGRAASNGEPSDDEMRSPAHASDFASIASRSRTA